VWKDHLVARLTRPRLGTGAVGHVDSAAGELEVESEGQALVDVPGTCHVDRNVETAGSVVGSVDAVARDLHIDAGKPLVGGRGPEDGVREDQEDERRDRQREREGRQPHRERPQRAPLYRS
jgi:hypothetical protein